MERVNRIERTYRELTTAGRRIIRLFSGNPNENGFHFPKEILKEVYDRYFEAQTYTPDPKGFLPARKAIAEYYENHGATVDPENIILTSGTSESFFYLFKLLAKAGDNILTPNPAYPLFAYIADLAGVELRHYRLDEEHDWRIDLENLRQKTDERTRAIVLISPNNPTGAAASAEEIREVTGWAASWGQVSGWIIALLTSQDPIGQPET